MREFSVELTMKPAQPLTVDALLEIAAIGGVASGTPGGDRFGTTLTVEAASPAEAVGSAVSRMPIAGEVLAAEVMTIEEADRRLVEPAFPEIVGMTEVAEMLGVSRQRVSALRSRPEFPAPVQTLAAGPIWRKGDLTTFAEGWQRKPGRPRLSA